MPFPAGAQTIVFTGTVTVPAGGGANSGKVVFTPSTRLVDASRNTVYSGGGAATLDSNGAFTITLLRTDSTGVAPTGWRWHVDEQPTGGQRASYWIELTAAMGATVDLADVAAVAAPDGGSLGAPPSGPAGGALAGSYPNPQLSAPTIASFDPAGAAAGAQTAAAADATAKVAAHEADTTNVHGITNTTALVTTTDPRLTDARTPTAHAATHAAAGSDPVALTQAQITGLAAALAALAPLAGATFTGVVTVDDANFVVLGTGKGYRFRPLGSRLDCEATGSDWMFSVFSGTNFDGTQRTYLRLEAGVTLAHACGTWIFADTADSGAVHTLDGTGNKLGFHGAAPVAKQTVTGSRGGNAALASLLTALANLGLITDSTTA